MAVARHPEGLGSPRAGPHVQGIQGSHRGLLLQGQLHAVLQHHFEGGLAAGDVGVPLRGKAASKAFRDDVETKKEESSRNASEEENEARGSTGRPAVVAGWPRCSGDLNRTGTGLPGLEPLTTKYS